MKNDNSIIVTFARDTKSEFSLSPITSNTIFNGFVLENINRTLFHRNAASEIQFESAERMDISEDGLSIEIKIKDGIRDSLGKALSSIDWINGIEEVVRRTKDKKSIAVLSKLEGWPAYIEGKEKFPVVCDEEKNTIRFKLTTSIPYLTEYLEMAYFGFWRFDINGEVIPTNDVVINKMSSDEISWSDSKENKTWITRLSKSSETISIKPNEIIVPLSSLKINGAQEMKGPPLALTFLEFSDNPSRPFACKNLRRYFASRVIEAKKEFSYSNDMLPTSSVYYSCQDSSTEKTSEITDTPSKQQKITILSPRAESQEAGGMIERIIEIFKGYFMDIELIQYDTSKDVWERVLKKDYDVRIGSVFAGTEPSKRVTEQMFCTTQGVCLPDHEGSIKKLLADIHDAETEILGQKLNSLIRQQASLVPLFNTRNVIYYGERVFSDYSNNISVIPDLKSLKLS